MISTVSRNDIKYLYFKLFYLLLIINLSNIFSHLLLIHFITFTIICFCNMCTLIRSQLDWALAVVPSVLLPIRRAVNFILDLSIQHGSDSSRKPLQNNHCRNNIIFEKKMYAQYQNHMGICLEDYTSRGK